jgi:hypothetical protein
LERAAEGREKWSILAVVFGMVQKVVQKVEDVKPLAANRWLATFPSAIRFPFGILLEVFG